MIKLLNNGPEDSLIEFRPRFKTRGKLQTRKLMYGHECDWCGNVIQAAFHTDEEIKLYDYEETRVISQGDKNEGELLMLVPSQSDRESAYKVDMYRTKNGNAQLIRLKNHIARWQGKGGDNEQFFEVGERCCRYIGVYTRDESEVINELALICWYNRDMLGKTKVNIPLSFLDEWKPIYTCNQLYYRLAPASGKWSTL